MKGTMKRRVSFLLAVLMLFTSVGFNVLAAEHSHITDPNNPNYSKVVNPTCTEKGYTIYYCMACSDLKTGNMVEASRGNYTEARGHSYGESYFVAANDEATSYNKILKCTRKYAAGENGICGHTIVEKENNTPVVYYKVDFINNRVPLHYICDINGVDLVIAYKSEDYGSYYVKAGTALEYDGTLPVLGKTRDFGRHTHIGWTTNSNLPITEREGYADTDFVSLRSVTENMTLYPVFEGEDVYYDVTFNSIKGQLTYAQRVKHGSSPVYKENADPNGKPYAEPEKEADLVNYYTFAGWTVDPYNSYRALPTSTVESMPIHGNANYYPVYTPVPKNYTIEFYGTNINDTPIFVANGVHLNSNLFEMADGVGGQIRDLTNKDNPKLNKEDDKTYKYEWNGKWRVLLPNGEAGEFVDLSYFRIMNENEYFVEKDEEGNTVTVNGEPHRIIRLVPEFDQRLIVYHVGVTMLLPDDEDKYYSLENAAVRVFDYNGQLITSGVTDENGYFGCKLNYKEGKPYTVKITTADSKYLGEAYVNGELRKGPDAGTEALLNACRVKMTVNSEYETSCSCIHHNAFFQPFFVGLFNLLYNIFNVRYECCFDMYSTIGPLLDYTKPEM